MEQHDFRTNPDDRWSYYVVDHLPTMDNIFRYDTVEEAIEKYKSLPENMKSAIGSSIHNKDEIDHIHRCDGKSVLVMDSERMQDPLWRESWEIQEAIDTMIAYLNVQHQYCSLFEGYPSCIVDLERYSGSEIENYFADKLLRPDGAKQCTDPGWTLNSAISEVFAPGKGWMNRKDFLKALNDSRPSRPGEGAKNLFVERLNINYMDEAGHMGQADISPRNFALLKEKTAMEIAPEKLAADLYAFACEVDPYDAADQADIREQELASIEKDIASGSLYPYMKQLSEGLSEGFATDPLRKEALSLMARLTVLTPKEFRKPALSAMIASAENAAGKQPPKEKQRNASEKEH